MFPFAGLGTLNAGPIGSVLSNSAANTPAWTVSPSSDNLLLYSNTAGVSQWTTSTYPTGALAVNSILYTSAANTVDVLPPSANANYILTTTVAGGAPSWQPAPASGITSLSAGVSGANSGGGLTFSSNPITSTGNIAIANTGVTAGTYGATNIVPQIAVNAQGQITSETDQTITPASIGMQNLTQGTGISAFTYNGSSAQTVTIANTGVTAGTYGATNIVPQIAVNAQGQITSEADQTITPASIGMQNLTQGVGMIPFTYNGSSAQTTGIANTGVTAGTYGTTTVVPQITVNAQGQITSEVDQPISAVGIGAVTSVTGTAPIVSSGGSTPAISLQGNAGTVFYGTGGGSSTTAAGNAPAGTNASASSNYLQSQGAGTPTWVQPVARVLIPMDGIGVAATVGKYYVGVEGGAGSINFAAPSPIAGADAAGEFGMGVITTSNGTFSKANGWVEGGTAGMNITISVYKYTPVNGQSGATTIAGTLLGTTTVVTTTANATYTYEIDGNAGTTFNKGDWIVTFSNVSVAGNLYNSGAVEVTYNVQ